MNNLHDNIWKLKYLEEIFLAYRYLFLRARRAASCNMYRLYTWWHYEGIELYNKDLTRILFLIKLFNLKPIKHYI